VANSFEQGRRGQRLFQAPLSLIAISSLSERLRKALTQDCLRELINTSNRKTMKVQLFLQGEQIIDILSGMSEKESNKVLYYKKELFTSSGFLKKDVDKERLFDFLCLMKKRNGLWRALLN